jgi:hypothetical protein
MGALLLIGVSLTACSDNSGPSGPTFPAKVTGDGIGGPVGSVFVQVIVNPGSVDRGRRGGVTVLVTNANGLPLAGRRVTLSPSAGRLDQTSGTTDANGTFSTTIFIPCEVSDGTVTIIAVVEGATSVPAPLTVVTSAGDDPCA